MAAAPDPSARAPRFPRYFPPAENQGGEETCVYFALGFVLTAMVYSKYNPDEGPDRIALDMREVREKLLELTRRIRGQGDGLNWQRLPRIIEELQARPIEVRGQAAPQSVTYLVTANCIKIDQFTEAFENCMQEQCHIIIVAWTDASRDRKHAMASLQAIGEGIRCRNSWGARDQVVSVCRRDFVEAYLVEPVVKERHAGVCPVAVEPRQDRDYRDFARHYGREAWAGHLHFEGGAGQWRSEPDYGADCDAAVQQWLAGGDGSHAGAPRAPKGLKLAQHPDVQKILDGFSEAVGWWVHAAVHRDELAQDGGREAFEGMVDAMGRAMTHATQHAPRLQSGVVEVFAGVRGGADGGPDVRRLATGMASLCTNALLYRSEQQSRSRRRSGA